MKPGEICNRGSVEDIRCTLRFGGYSTSELLEEIAYESKNKNRTTVKRMLWAKVEQNWKATGVKKK